MPSTSSYSHCCGRTRRRRRPRHGRRLAVEVLRDKRIGAVLVTDAAGHLVGILSERDIVRRLADTPGRTLPQTVAELMTADPQTCTLDETLVAANRALVDGEIARFPDAVTSRGLKHLGELSTMVSSGARAVMCYLIQRGDANLFAPADRIDPAYGEGLRDAASRGVELIAWSCDVTPESIAVVGPVPVSLERTA